MPKKKKTETLVDDLAAYLLPVEEEEVVVEEQEEVLTEEPPMEKPRLIKTHKYRGCPRCNQHLKGYELKCHCGYDLTK